LDGSGSFLVTPSETRAFLEKAGFRDIVMDETGEKYLAGYKQRMAPAASVALPSPVALGLSGGRAAKKIRNSARNIEEGRTQPVQAICRKPV
jgi:hypothetical protein